MVTLNTKVGALPRMTVLNNAFGSKSLPNTFLLKTKLKSRNMTIKATMNSDKSVDPKKDAQNKIRKMFKTGKTTPLSEVATPNTSSSFDMYSKMSAAEISQLMAKGMENVKQILKEEGKEVEGLTVVKKSKVKKTTKIQSKPQLTSPAAGKTEEEKAQAQARIKAMFQAGKKETPLSEVAKPVEQSSFDMYSSMSSAEISRLVTEGKRAVEDIRKEEGEGPGEVEGLTILKKSDRSSRGEVKPMPKVEEDQSELGRSRRAAQAKIKEMFQAGGKETPLHEVAKPDEPSIFLKYRNLNQTEMDMVIRRGRENILHMQHEAEEEKFRKVKRNLEAYDMGVHKASMDEAQERVNALMSQRSAKAAAQERIRSLFKAGKEIKPLQEVVTPSEPSNFEKFSKMSPAEQSVMISRGKASLLAAKEKQMAERKQRRSSQSLPEVDPQDLQASRDEAHNRIKSLMQSKEDSSTS